jgi:hypothetical protein
MTLMTDSTPAANHKPRRRPASARTDCHRPGAIVPSDYVHILFYALPDPSVPGDRGVNLPELTQLLKLPVDVFGGHGKCGVCGASFRYGELWSHEPTKNFVHFGHDCAQKYELFADRADWNAQLESLKTRRAAYIQGVKSAEKRAKLLAANPGLEAALNHSHRVCQDIARRFEQYSSISPKQIALVMKIAAGPTRERPEEVNVPAPVSEKRQLIEGRVVSKKSYESQWGETTKTTIKVTTEAGVWLCFGKLPVFDAEIGDVVSFMGRLEAGREPHFAFYSRPTQGSILSSPRWAGHPENVQGMTQEDQRLLGQGDSKVRERVAHRLALELAISARAAKFPTLGSDNFDEASQYQESVLQAEKAKILSRGRS